MEMELLQIHKNQISINAREVLSLLGTSGGEVDQHALEVIEEYIPDCTSIMTPKGGYALFDAAEPESKEEIKIEGTRFQTGKIVRNLLRNSEQYAFFTVTAGPEPEVLARSLMDSGQFLEGFIVDLIGSGIVDSAANQVHEYIRNLVGEQGLKVTNIYSPGYCSWNVDEQQKLFRLLPEGFCGITLSESSLMSPIKSLSGIIGIGSSVKFNDYTCQICSMKNCRFSFKN